MDGGGYDGSDRFARRGSDRTLQLILREVATQSLRMDQLEDALHVSTAVGRARKKLAASILDRKAALAEHEGKVVEELRAIVARQDAELIEMIRQDDEQIDAAERAAAGAAQ